VPLFHQVPNTISQCVPVLKLCHCYIQCPTQYHSVFPSLSCPTVPTNAQHNNSVFPSFSCATVPSSAKLNIRVCCSTSVVPLLYPVPNTLSQCVAVLQLCHSYIQCPTKYHSLLQSLSCATVPPSAQHNITVCCSSSAVPLFHPVPNKISLCVPVLQLCHCSIQCPTKYHSVWHSFSCATVTFSA